MVGFMVLTLGGGAGGKKCRRPQFGTSHLLFTVRFITIG